MESSANDVNRCGPPRKARIFQGRRGERSRRMKRGEISGIVAVVAPTRGAALAAAADLAPRLSRARLVPFSAASYLREPSLLPAILATAGRDKAAARRFLEAMRRRILWPSPPGDLYAAIAGFLTRLPPRRPDGPSRDGDAGAPALLLEGRVGTARARGALALPARHWIVEHAGRVDLPAAELAALRHSGVEWFALEPVRLVGILDASGASRSLFPDVRLWRPSGKRPYPVRGSGSATRARRPSRK